MRWALLVLLTGCGRIGFAGLGDGGPGGGGDDAPGGGGGDGAMTDGMIDATISPGCGATKIIDDDFSAPPTVWTPINTGTYNTAQLSGIYRISVQTSTPSGSRAGLKQTATIDFTGTCAILELSAAPAGANVRAYLRLGTPAKNIEMYVENAQLWGRFTVNATTGTIGPTQYSAATMRFLRMREAAGNYVMEYSAALAGPYATIGQQGGSFANPSPSSLEVGALAAGAVGAATTVEFERVLFLGP